MMGYDPAAYQQLYAQQAQALQQVAQAAASYSQYAGYSAGSASVQQPAQQAAPQQTQPAQQQLALPVQCVGQTAHIAVNGCTHGTVGGIVRGNFTANGQNHGKPTYKKDHQVNGLDVMLYFWDERDGPNFCGWWFGPKVGGDQVWAYHPSRQSLTPPTKGWKVPYDGPVDDSFSISPASAASAAASAQQSYAQAYQQQQPNAGGNGKGYGHMPQNDQQRWDLQAQNRRQHEQRRAMQKREEEMRQQQQAEVMRKAAERKMQMEEEQRRLAERQRMEQDACTSIRSVCQKLRYVQEESFQQVQQELYEVMQRELNNCGHQMARIREECDQAAEQARQRLQEAAEVKAFQEKKKAEMLEAHKAACAKAEELVAEFTAKVEAAERAAKALAEKAEPFTSDESGMGDQNSEDKILEEAAKIDEAKDEATARTSESQEYLTQHKATMTVQDLPGQPPAEVKQVLSKVMERLLETTKKKDAVMLKIHLVKSKALKRSKAKQVMEDRKAKFSKYAKDGVLDKKQVVAYSKKEFGFALTEVAAGKIFKALQVTKGVTTADFQRLRVQIGILREQKKDLVRRQAREEREKELETSKAELREKIQQLSTQADAVEASVKKVEDATEQLIKVDGELRSSQLHDKCLEAASLIKAAQEGVAAIRTGAGEMREGVEADLKAWLGSEFKPLDGKCSGYERRIHDATLKHRRAEGEARLKEAQEVANCQKSTVAVLKHHQQVKELTTEDLVKAIAGDAETVSKENFLAFFDGCEKHEDAPVPDKEELSRFFDQLDDEKEGFLTQEHMLTVVRTLKKVTKETMITKEADVSEDTQALVKLEAGDIVELLSEPSEQGTLLRARCRSMKDGTRGWVTIKGNQGAIFLTDGGNTWRVQRETILTKGFDISTMAEEDRKLKPNELVGLREWMQKDEKSGLMRMKCKTKNDGTVGWVTAVGNTGTVFLTAH